MAARWTAWLLWAVVAACGVFWGLRLGVGARPVPAHAVTVGTVQTVAADPARLFAAPQAASAPVALEVPSAAASRLRLLGVIAPAGAKEPRADGTGFALIAVDGKPARAVALGAKVDGDWVLQALGVRSAHVGPAGGPAVAVLEVPPLSAAATGVLPSVRQDAPFVVPPPAGLVPPAGAVTPMPVPGAVPPGAPPGASPTPAAPPAAGLAPASGGTFPSRGIPRPRLPEGGAAAPVPPPSS